MTQTHVDPRTARLERKESPLGLLVATIRDNLDAGSEKQRAAFRLLVLSDGYEDFLDALIGEWLSIRYTTALVAAKPPSVAEIKRKADERKLERQRNVVAVKAAKDLIGSRLLDLVMPNGKLLRNCTGADCIKFGGLYTRIGKKVGDRRIVGRVLSSEDIAAFMKR